MRTRLRTLCLTAAALGMLALLPPPIHAKDEPIPPIEAALAAARAHLAAAPLEHRSEIFSMEWQRDGTPGPRWRIDLFPRPDRKGSNTQGSHP